MKQKRYVALMKMQFNGPEKRSQEKVVFTKYAFYGKQNEK